MKETRWGFFLPGCIILGFAPRYARFTLAFLPSMIGFGSLQALSAAVRSAMVTLINSANHEIVVIVTKLKGSNVVVLHKIPYSFP